ncbi:MAG: sigma-70 family RNA polymerase sigma factor [Verrucomicrobiales bacterium]|nr:sigma-70 family RNA polymerase sigma factor [Verrucomicrobiales bacterium]
MRSNPTIGEGGEVFPTTIWHLIASSAPSSPSRQEALEQLCRIYWRPLYAFLRRQGIGSNDAQDLVQGFLARLLERGDLENTDPGKGRFRSYLLAGLRNFVIKKVEHDQAQKRGGALEFISLDLDKEERLSLPDMAAPTPEAACDRQLARILLARALQSLREEQTARGKDRQFAALEPFLDGAGPQEYVAIAKELGLTPNAVAVTVHRLRGRLKELLRAEIVPFTHSRSEADAELRELLTALSET